MQSNPQITLVPGPKRLRVRDFLDKLGALMFGKEWQSKYLQLLSSEPPPLNNEGHQVFFVLNNIVEALRLGIAIGEIEVTDLSISVLYPDELQKKFGSATVPRISAGIYPINPSFWVSDDFDYDKANWGLSTISVPAEYIDFNIAGRHELPRNVETLNVPFYVAEPDVLLSKALQIPPVAGPDLIGRYRDTQRSIWLEIMGVAWRLLAIEKPTDTHGLQQKLIDKIRHYMLVHRLENGGDEQGVSEAAMKAVVSKILKQWREQNILDSVLVSSTPIPR